MTKVKYNDRNVKSSSEQVQYEQLTKSKIIKNIHFYIS